MAFKKGAAQAQKEKPKGAQTGKKAPPQKNLLAAKLEEDDDDFDEDDDDLDFNEDSDLSGADEDLDDEELDDEELDDEEDDDEDEEESEDEEAPAGRASGQQQGTPARAAVNGKRKAEDDLGPSSPKKVRLQDHIPPDQVIDYEQRDLCDVKLFNFAADVTEQDVKNLCKDAVDVRPRKFKNKLSCAFVRYANKDKAAAAVQALQGAKLKGQPFTVQYCGTRWADPATRPRQVTNTLDVRGLPKSLQDKKKLAALYPTGQVLKVFSDGYAQIRFPSTDALIKAVKVPSGRTVDGTDLRLAVAIDVKDKQPRRGGKKSPPSTKKGATQNQRARRPGQKGTPGTKGSPKTPQQQKGKSPGQKGGPKTPAKQASPKTPGKQASPKTPGKQATPKTPGKQATPKTPGKTPGQAKGGAGMPKVKGTPYPKKFPKGTPDKA